MAPLKRKLVQFMHCNVYTLKYSNVPEMLILKVSLRQVWQTDKFFFTESLSPEKLRAKLIVGPKYIRKFTFKFMK